MAPVKINVTIVVQFSVTRDTGAYLLAWCTGLSISEHSLKYTQLHKTVVSLFYRPVCNTRDGLVGGIY